eukprot:gene5701-5763_t
MKRNRAVTDMDHRQVGRDSLFLMADLRVEGEAGEHRVKVRNLSARGMMAECTVRVRSGVAVTVNLRNIGWVPGRVAWIQDNRFGIAFADAIDPLLARAPGGPGVGDHTPRYLKPVIAAPDPRSMRKLRRTLLRLGASPVSRFPMLCASAVLMLTAACGRSGTGAVDISVIGPEPAPIAISANANPTAHAGQGSVPFDPAGFPASAATRAGLVGFDAVGRLVPALAERWIVTDDGLGYIFRLRDAQWFDGAPITGSDVATALRRALAAAHGTPIGADLAGIRTVRVMAQRVIEIDLDVAQPDLLTLLAQPELAIVAGPRGQHHAGPMDMRREGSHWLARLVPPDRPGLPLVPPPAVSRPLALRFQSAQAAVDRFAVGKADLVLGGTFDSLPLVTRIAMARGNLHFDPVAGLFGLDVLAPRGFLADAANREALAMAIDRDGLVAAFGVSGWQATTRVVSAGLDGDSGAVAERWTDRTLDQRRAAATDRVKAWISAQGKANAGTSASASAPVLTLALPGGAGADILFQRLHDDFAAIGVTLQRGRKGQAADLALIDSVARYPRARWFLERLSCASHRQVCSEAGDSALQAAIRSGDAAAAADLLAQAEGQITMANGFVPLARPLRWSLVHGSVAGLLPNPWGWHALPPMAGADSGNS